MKPISRPMRTGLTLLALALAVAPRVTAGEAPRLEIIDAVNLMGTTGLVTTPVAGVLPSGTIAFGFSGMGPKWAYNGRGLQDNYHYFLAVGFVPRVELAVRISYFPQGRLFRGTREEGTVDRGGSGRILLLTEGDWRPALAVGGDDVRGTRRFHALYAVASKTFDLPPKWLQARVSAGYGSTVLDAKQYVLEGGFGGGELVFSDVVSLALDYDSEKWNTLIRLVAFKHLAVRYALLNFEVPAGGLTWTQSF